MRRSIVLVIFGIIYPFAIPFSCAYNGIQESLSSSPSHQQIVNQELDKLEPSGNGPITVFVPVSSAPAPVTRAAVNDQTGSRSLIPRKRVEFDFGREYYWARYVQPGIERQKGFMSGYEGSLTYRTASSKPIVNMYRLEGQWAQGKFDNRSSDGVISWNGIKDNAYEIRGIAGKEFYPLSYFRMTGYSGFGYRYLEDNPEGLSTVSGGYTILGYKTFSHYCYMPFGIDMLYQRNRSYSVDSNVEFDYMFRGWETSNLGVIQQGYNTTKNLQTGFGLRLGLRLNLYFKYCDAFAETFLRYWDIGQSNGILDPVDPVNNPPLEIPKNNTEELGFRFGLLI